MTLISWFIISWFALGFLIVILALIGSVVKRDNITFGDIAFLMFLKLFGYGSVLLYTVLILIKK